MTAALVVTFMLTILVPAGASAQGWYLMAPPIASAGGTVDLSAPLSQWSELHAYDSAKTCEEEKMDNYEVIRATDELSIKVAARRRIERTMPERDKKNRELERSLLEHNESAVRDLGDFLRRDARVALQYLSSRCISAADPRLAPKTTR